MGSWAETSNAVERRDVWRLIASECARNFFADWRHFRFWWRRMVEALRYSEAADPPADWPHGNPHVWLRERRRV